MKNDAQGITFRSVAIGAVFAGFFSAITTLLDNRYQLYIAANQIPLFPYILLLLTAIVINPICRAIRFVHRMTRAEILVVFIMCMVTSSISSFGLMGEWVPLMSSMFNRHWNNDQSEWNTYVTPYLNDHYFISAPGIRKAAQDYRDAVRDAGAADPADTETVLRLQERVADTRAGLRQKEERAFDKVETFRRGLPRGMRAFPGILPIAEEDDAVTYFERLRRLYHGKRSLRHLTASIDLLEPLPADAAIPPDEAARTAAWLAEAAAALAPIASDQAIGERLASLAAENEQIAHERNGLNSRMVELSEARRTLDAAAARKLKNEIDVLHRKILRLAEDKHRIDLRTERTQSLLRSTAAANEAREEIVRLRAGMPDAPAAGAIRTRIEEIVLRYPGFDASLRRYFLSDIPWEYWIGPSLRWLLLATLFYLVMMTFNVLIFRQWAYNEKLIYPLAELPEVILGQDADRRVFPVLFSSGLFWTGFAISASVLGWNLLARSGALPGISSIDLRNVWEPYVVNSAFAPLGSVRSEVFFTMIGVAFLIPKKVSFSLWFFMVLFFLQVLFMCWAGQGQNLNSFPREPWYTLNFGTAEGGGALLVFASVVLYKSRKYILCAFSSSAIRDLPRDERVELRVSSALFLLGSLGIVLILTDIGVHFGYAVLGYIFMMVITIGLVRAVAEGGVLSYQAWFGPFHFMRHTFGFGKTWTAPPLVTPLMVYYSVLLFDIKAFIGPAMANSLKIRDDLRLRRGKFHLVIALSILVAVAVSFLSALFLGYSSGADSMSQWFYNAFPQSVFDQIAAISKSPPLPTSAERFWLAFGAAFMALLLFLRQRFFWVPHPIGAIMLVNPIMNAFWFSIFLGWLVKTLVTKYGNKDTYAKTRGLFVGMIVGELVLVFVATMVSLSRGWNMGIDLNRN